MAIGRIVTSGCCSVAQKSLRIDWLLYVKLGYGR